MTVANSTYNLLKEYRDLLKALNTIIRWNNRKYARLIRKYNGKRLGYPF